MITREASNLGSNLLAGYPEFSQKYAEDHPTASPNDIINAYLGSADVKTKISASAKDLAAKLGDTDLAKTLENALSSYMKGRLVNIMAAFMKSVMENMQNQLAAELGGNAAASMDAMKNLQVAIKINPVAFASAFNVNMDQAQMLIKNWSSVAASNR